MLSIAVTAPASNRVLPQSAVFRRNLLLESRKDNTSNRASTNGPSTLYTAEIVPTMDPRAPRFRAQFETRSKAMVHAITQIDLLFPDTDNCDVAAELWTSGSVELPGYKVRIQARLCSCSSRVRCSFCDWRERANRVRLARTPSRSRGVLVAFPHSADETHGEE
jgi:hypothetical protein